MARPLLVVSLPMHATTRTGHMTLGTKQGAGVHIRVRSSVKVGGPILQHNHVKAVRVRSNVKVGGPVIQHNHVKARSRSSR
jgi:hypothetical protein